MGPALQDKDVTTLAPDAGSYAIVQAFLSGRLQTANTPARTLHRMQVVTDEIWSNIVHYSGAARASLRLSREGDTLYLNFRDNGWPYDPTAAAAPDLSLSADDRPIGAMKGPASWTSRFARTDTDSRLKFNQESA